MWRTDAGMPTGPYASFAYMPVLLTLVMHCIRLPQALAPYGLRATTMRCGKIQPKPSTGNAAQANPSQPLHMLRGPTPATHRPNGPTQPKPSQAVRFRTLRRRTAVASACVRASSLARLSRVKASQCRSTRRCVTRARACGMAQDKCCLWSLSIDPHI